MSTISHNIPDIHDDAPETTHTARATYRSVVADVLLRWAND